MDIRVLSIIILTTILCNVSSKEREELIPQKGRNTTCHCMAAQLCPRVLVRYTKYYIRTGSQNQEECPLYKVKCCEPKIIPVLKTNHTIPR